jgi:hypothetical protein
MKLTRSSRFATAIVTLFCLLFMQLAVAAYACPSLEARQAPSLMRDAAGIPMANCDGIDHQSPSLCHAHSEQGKQSLDKAQTPPVQPFVASGVVIAVTASLKPIPAGVALPDAFLMAASADPPLAILHCCFRI